MSVRSACCTSGAARILSLVLLLFRQALPLNRQYHGHLQCHQIHRVVQSLMSRQILQLLSMVRHLQITIGIILLVTIHYGQPLTKQSQFMTHVLRVGVFPTAEVVVSGQRL